MTQLKKVAIVGGSRIPFCRSVTNYAHCGNKELMTGALKGLVQKFHLENKTLGEVVLGAVLKRSKDFSLARESALAAGLSYQTPAYDIQQACGTSLEAAILIGHKIALGQIESGIAGGVDTSSDVPIELSIPMSQKLVQMTKEKSITGKLKLWKDFSPKDLLPKLPAIAEPQTGLSMGEHCELMAKEWNIGRREQDELALKSHLNAENSYQSGFQKDLVIPFEGVTKDNNIRSHTTLEKLSKLSPAFDKSEKGTLTAGNSSPLTDGAAAVFLCSEDYAKAHHLEVEAYLSFSQVAAVDYVNDEGLLMAPVYALSRMLDRANLNLATDFDFYEIHEAFAAQVLCTLKALNDEEYCRKKLGRKHKMGQVPLEKLNVMGSSIAFGHPFAATGARILTTTARLLKQKGQGRALISICTAGGMGVTAIVERPGT